MGNAKKIGIFINHRHNNNHLAGRIYDFFKQKAMNPFLDIYSLHQGRYKDDIIKIINETPYFLCVLTPGALDNLDPDNPDDIYYKELEAAFSNDTTKVLVVTLGEIEMPADLPEKIQDLKQCHYYTLTKNMSNFYTIMDQLYEEDISQAVLREIRDWKEAYLSNARSFIASRTVIESEIATLENRFGKELIASVKDGTEFTGQQRIKQIRMSCYAASVIFTPQRAMMDAEAYDRGLMFNIFASLLKDPDFSLEIIINAPDCLAMTDAIENEKLGNRSLDNSPESVFFCSYFSMCNLAANDPVFVAAVKEKRFKFMVTENVLPYAIFQIIYKDEWKEYNHIKVDLYSEGIDSNMERRCMLFFENTDRDNYSFFESRYKYIRNARESKMLIAAHHDEWVQKWEEIEDE